MNEINKTRHSVEKGAERATKTFAAVKEDVHTAADEAKGHAEDLLEEIQSRGSGAWSGAKTWIRKNPATALGCAVILGAVVSALLVRSSSKDQS